LALQDGRGFGASDNEDDFEDVSMTTEDILQGRVEFEISHAGGEFQAELQKDMHKAKCVLTFPFPLPLSKHKFFYLRRHDTRIRKDVVQRRVLGFRGQMKAITDAYIKWGASQGQFGLDSPPAPPPAAAEDIDGVYSLKVVDMFSESHSGPSFVRN
jgi:hypothetical protein